MGSKSQWAIIWIRCLVHPSVGDCLDYLIDTGSIIPWLGDLNCVRVAQSSLVPSMHTFALSLFLDVIWLVFFFFLIPALTFLQWWTITVLQVWVDFSHSPGMEPEQEWTYVIILDSFFSLLYTVFFFGMYHIAGSLETVGTQYVGADCYLYFCLVLLLMRVKRQSSREQRVSGLLES